MRCISACTILRSSVHCLVLAESWNHCTRATAVQVCQSLTACSKLSCTLYFPLLHAGLFTVQYVFPKPRVLVTTSAGLVVKSPHFEQPKIAVFKQAITGISKHTERANRVVVLVGKLTDSSECLLEAGFAAKMPNASSVLGESPEERLQSKRCFDLKKKLTCQCMQQPELCVQIEGQGRI
jgi:hypothetical protein